MHSAQVDDLRRRVNARFPELACYHGRHSVRFGSSLSKAILVDPVAALHEDETFPTELCDLASRRGDFVSLTKRVDDTSTSIQQKHAASQMTISEFGAMPN